MTDIQTRIMERQQDPSLAPTLVRRKIREGKTQSQAWSEVYGFSDEDQGERESTSDHPRIRIDGELFHVTNTREIGYGDLVEIDTSESESFIVSSSPETAGEAASQRWREMAQDDPQEFACIVGEATLVSWALGQYAGPGNTQVRSLDEWLELVADHPQEEWAGYDGYERTVDRVGKLASELGFTPTVAYRSN